MVLQLPDQNRLHGEGRHSQNERKKDLSSCVLFHLEDRGMRVRQTRQLWVVVHNNDSDKYMTLLEHFLFKNFKVCLALMNLAS